MMANETMVVFRYPLFNSIFKFRIEDKPLLEVGGQNEIGVRCDHSAQSILKKSMIGLIT